MRLTRIAGTGHYVPDRVVTNQELEALMDTSDEWIRERTGIRERRFAGPGQGSTEMGVRAARAAMEKAGWEPSDVQMVLFATLSPDMFFPGDGVLLQQGADKGLIVHNQDLFWHSHISFKTTFTCVSILF